MSRNFNFAEIKRAGFAAGRNATGLPTYEIHCPFDGRTKEGKTWWDGFMTGEAERCAASNPATETIECEINFATGEFRELDPVPPFHQEPAFGSPEAVGQAAETLRGPGAFFADMAVAELAAERDRLRDETEGQRARLKDLRDSETYWKTAAEKALADLDRQHALAAEGSKQRDALADALEALGNRVADLLHDFSVVLAEDRRGQLLEGLALGREALRKAGR